MIGSRSCPRTEPIDAGCHRPALLYKRTSLSQAQLRLYPGRIEHAERIRPILNWPCKRSLQVAYLGFESGQRSHFGRRQHTRVQGIVYLGRQGANKIQQPESRAVGNISRLKLLDQAADLTALFLD